MTELDDNIKLRKKLPSEGEIAAAWELRNAMSERLLWRNWDHSVPEVGDAELQALIDAALKTGVTQHRIDEIATKTWAKSQWMPFDTPLDFTGWGRLAFAHWLAEEDGLQERYSPDEDGDIGEYRTEKEAHYLNPIYYSQEVVGVGARQRRETEARRAARANDPYQRIWADDRPLLLGYHDRHCLLPRYRDGGIGLIVGEKNHLKTTITVMLLVEAMVADHDLRILYLAGEQPGDVKNKVVHYGVAAGLTVEDLRARFHIRDGLPPLHHPENAEELLNAAERLNVGIVVVDTYQHSITGLDENSSKAAELSTNGGTFGRLKARGRLALILGHPPGSGEPRFRGNTGIEGAADFIVTFRATHSKGSFKAEVINMRGTAAGAIAHATFPKVPANLTEEQRLALPPPDITWSTVREYNAVTHDPRPSIEPAPSEPARSGKAAAPPEKLSAGAARVRRFRERQRNAALNDVTPGVTPITD